MLERDTLENQIRLANYCRNGEVSDITATLPEHLHHYRRLVFNVVKDALRSTYPLTHNLLTSKEWGLLVHDFFEQHACTNPQVWLMPRELMAFVTESCQELVGKYPQLNDLLRLEWIETAYYMMPDRIFPLYKSGDLWSEPWALNPEFELLSFSYPVHLKNAKFISRTDASLYFCLVFRQPETYKVKFINLSPFLAWLLENVYQRNSSPFELLPEMKSLFGLADESVLRTEVLTFASKMKDSGMLL